jgi:hypothetical protein
MTRRSDDIVMDNPNFRFKEMAIDMENRDPGQVHSSDVLNPRKMKFWSLPENVVYVPLGLPF